MARLDQIPEPVRSHIAGLNCAPFDTQPWVEGPPIYWERVAIVSTGDIYPAPDDPVTSAPGDGYRVIPRDVKTDDLVMGLTGSDFDRSGFEQDPNVVFPLALLKAQAADRSISGVARYHYSFKGTADPRQLESAARHVAGLMKADLVNTVLLVPVSPTCTRAVNGLAHFFEAEGIATTLISLIREHTVIMKPPRALWVPFDLGRPLGAPNDPDLQRQVLLAALVLIEAENGPVLRDFTG